MGGLQTKRGRLQAVAAKGSNEDIANNREPINAAALVLAVDVCKSKLEFLASLPPQEVDANELYKIGNCLAGLTRATVETRRFQLELAGAIKLAADLLKGEIRTQLLSEPELVQGLKQQVDTAVLKLEQ